MKRKLLLLFVLLVFPMFRAVAGQWQTVPIGGGGYVTGLVSDATSNYIYCRTDVGGAFRWDFINNQWISVTDTLVPTTTTYSTTAVAGILSLAIDPTNSSKLYVAAGNYASDALRGIFSSNDRGVTWTQILSVIVNGNGGSKTTGERLVVDPNNPNILWYGSSHNGLQKGVYTSGTWSWTQVPSTSVPFGQVPVQSPPLDKIGVSFVACDKNGTNTIVYAGVYDSVGTGSTGGIYKTSDGAKWSKVSGVSLVKPLRGQVAPNGTLYVTQSGTVGKLLRGGSMTAIAPLAGVNYDGLAVALGDTTGNTVYIAERNGGGPNGRIWRTTNSGTTWTVQGTYTRLGEPDGTPSVTRPGWFSCTTALMVSATNANELWASDFLGVMRTQNAQDIGVGKGATWNSLQKGQEEFCVMALKAPASGPVLMSAGADLGGYRHNDITVRPCRTGGNHMTNMEWGSVCGLDYCEANTNLWVRSWNNGNNVGGSGGFSLDGGVTWLVFGEVASKIVSNDGTPRWENWDVSTYLSSQKAKGQNAVTLVMACGSTGTAGALYFQSKEGNASCSPRLLVNGTTTLTTTADSWISNTSGTTNHGSSGYLQTGYYGSTNIQYIYLKFDLSRVTAITSGTLRMYLNGTSYPVQLPAGVYGCNDASWGESTITWNNKPAPYSSGTARTADMIGTPSYYDGSVALAGGRVAISSTNPNVMVWMSEGTSNRPHFSNDRGVTWTSSTGSPLSQIADRYTGNVLQPLTADRVNGKFYAARFSGATNGNHLVYASTDGGANWVISGTVSANTSNVWRAQIVAAPVSNHVWVSDDGIAYPTLGGLWRSMNGGATWSRISDKVITAVREVSFGAPVSGTGYTVFINGFKNGANGIYRSDDYGKTWNLVDTSPTDISIDVLEGDRRNYGSVYLGTSGRGIFLGKLTPSYNISSSESPLGAGTTTGAGVYQSGSSATLTATPSSGYGFAVWTESGTPVSTSASYSFSVSGTRTLVANFQPATFATWKADNFTTAEQANSAIIGNLADPDGDGFANLLEYALGMKPKAGGRPALLQQQIVNGYLTLTYTRSKASTDLAYTVEVSSDLKTWNSGSTYTFPPVVTLDTGFTQTVQVSDRTPFSAAGMRFIRLRVTSP